MKCERCNCELEEAAPVALTSAMETDIAEPTTDGPEELPVNTTGRDQFFPTDVKSAEDFLVWADGLGIMDSLKEGISVPEVVRALTKVMARDIVFRAQPLEGD